jgi:drug/metabolite transporter (DMT)-like permease
LCRLALLQGSIDAASFTAIRLVAGALALSLLSLFSFGRGKPSHRSFDAFLPGGLLFLYAAPFSFAYVSLGAGVGALLLFGAVQLTMLIASISRGDRPGVREWSGLTFAFLGLVILSAPALLEGWRVFRNPDESPASSATGVLLMIASGVSWGLYSLRGRGATSPIEDNALAFRVACLPALLLLTLSVVLRPSSLHATSIGVLWAAISGSLTSGLGYALWYRALPHLSAVAAGVVQLSVPVLAAALGVLFLGEAVTLRFAVAAALVLGGVGLGISSKKR